MPKNGSKLFNQAEAICGDRVSYVKVVNWNRFILIWCTYMATKLSILAMFDDKRK